MQRLALSLMLLCFAAAGAARGQQPLGRQAVVPIDKAPATDMTHEETVVRTAYAKFAYASEQEAIGHLALEAGGAPVPAVFAGLTSDQRLALAQVSFRLSDFAVGNLRDIIGRKAIDLVSPPVGEMLSAATPTYSYSDAGFSTIWYSLQPRWLPASATSPEVLSATLGELHEMEWHSQAPTAQWQRYASYSVTATFQGKSRGPYKALFIFGHDEKGNEMVMPEDATTDSSALATVLAAHLFPEAFVRTTLRTYPVVANWLSAHQRFSTTCSRGQGDVCCDLVQLQCGLGSGDVADGLSKPLPGSSPR